MAKANTATPTTNMSGFKTTAGSSTRLRIRTNSKPTTAAAPAATVIGTRKRHQCSHAASAATEERDRRRALSIERHGAVVRQQAGRRPVHAADKCQEQDDGRQGHAAAAREILGQCPGDCADARAAQREVQLHADPADRTQHQRRGSHDENVVESGDEAEMLLVRRRRGPARGNMVPQRRGGFGRQGAGCQRIVDIAFAVHERKPVPRACYPVTPSPACSVAIGFGVIWPRRSPL